MLKGLLNLISFLNFNNWNNTIKHNSHQEAVCTDEKLLKTLKNRFNYASSACSARILSTNPEALSPSALLAASSKDTYLRYSCSVKGKFVVVELCEEVKIDIIVVANYELFSSTVKGFKVYAASDKLIDPSVAQILWKLILSATIQADSSSQIHSEQAFPVTSSESFVKYLRIEFDDEHYGHERLCPISVLKVYGKTMLDEFSEDLHSDPSSESTTDNLPTVSPHETSALALLLAEINEINDKMNELSSGKGGNVFVLECSEADQQIQDLKDRYKDLESRSLEIQSLESRKRKMNGNVFKNLHDRLNKLEVSLKKHPLNFFLFRSRRQEADDLNNIDIIPKLIESGSNGLDDLLSNLSNEISNLKSELKHLHSIQSSQKFKITILLSINGIFMVLLLIKFIGRMFTKRTFSLTNNPDSELKRRPLLDLKSPNGSSSNLNGSGSGSGSKIGSISNSKIGSGSISNITGNTDKLQSQHQSQSKSSLTPGVVLSDDEVLLLDEQ